MLETDTEYPKADIYKRSRLCYNDWQTSETQTAEQKMKYLLEAGRLTETSIFSLPEWLIWCGSMIQDTRGKCHLYFSAWERRHGFDAWVTHSRIGYACAETPASPYRFQSWILSGSGCRNTWDRDVTHNPAILKSDGRYYLYYMGNFSDSGDWWDHRNHQQAGVAWSRKPEGPFHRLKKPVIRQKDAVIISNPSVCRLPDGRFLMIYKWVAQENPAPFYGPVCHGAAFADNPLGPFIPVRRKLFTVDGCDFPGEDPFVFTVNGRLFCILKDNGRNYSGLLKALLLFESQDGLTWEKAGIALSRNIPCENGHKKRFFRLERPQLAFCKDQIRLFCAVKPSEKNDEAFSINIPITFSIRIAQEAENRKFTL